MTTISTLWRALESNYGLLVLAGMFYLGWKMSTWKGSIENRLSGVENLAERYAKKTDEIYTIIVGRFGRSVDQATSPVTLTEYGAELSGKINARKTVDAYADALYQEAKDMNAYEDRHARRLLSGRARCHSGGSRSPESPARGRGQALTAGAKRHHAHGLPTVTPARPKAVIPAGF
ncbi:MAG: hypothetical protein OXU62_06770 [Gammaproteobacteria bacterium]|nr:hypothetical protein [Gammaproteobacteria bacterium]